MLNLLKSDALYLPEKRGLKKDSHFLHFFLEFMGLGGY
jgi:hypothetical protein